MRPAPAESRQGSRNSVKKLWKSWSYFSRERSFPGVSSNCVFQESIVSRSDTGESVQFQREQKLRLAVAVAIRHRASRDGAQLVTAGLVFEAGELIERLGVEIGRASCR